MALSTADLNDVCTYLKAYLDDVCFRLAEKFQLYANGKPRKALILDVLAHYSCPCCAIKALTQMRDREVDALYRETHDFAAELLVYTLKNVAEPNIRVDREVWGEYGRVDVKIGPLEGNEGNAKTDVLVEVKVGSGFSLKQALRYLVSWPKTTLILWRVGKKQLITIDGVRHLWLVSAFMEWAIGRGLTLLNWNGADCGHEQNRAFRADIANAQQFLDEFFDGLAYGLPKAVSLALQIHKGVLAKRTEPKLAEFLLKEAGNVERAFQT